MVPLIAVSIQSIVPGSPLVDNDIALTPSRDAVSIRYLSQHRPHEGTILGTLRHPQHHGWVSFLHVVQLPEISLVPDTPTSRSDPFTSEDVHHLLALF